MKIFFKLNIKQLVGRAMLAIEPLTPVQYVYSLHTRDLRNVQAASMLYDNKGRRLAGRFASTDITDGSPSPIIWAWFWPMLLLSVAGTILLCLATVFGAWIPISAYSSSYMAQGSSGTVGSIFSACLSVYLGMVAITSIAMIPTWIMTYYGYLIVAEAEPTRMAHNAYWLLVGFPSKSIVLIPVLGPAVAAIGTLALPWAFYWLRTNSFEFARHTALKDASDSAKGLTGLPDADIHERQRKVQAEKAFKDVLHDGRPAPLMTLGVETGWVRETTGNPLSSDKGAVVGISLGEDSSTHLWFFGNTGSGKTSGGFRRVVKAWHDNNMGGQLVMDAKGGSLPIEMHAEGLVKHLVWPAKGTKINLMASMNPVAFAAAMAKCFSDHRDSSGNGSVFDGSTRIYIACAASLLKFGVMHDVPGVRNSFGYLDTFCTDPDERTRVLVYMSTNMEKEFRAKPSLRKAHYQWAMRYPSLAEATRTSVDFTLDVWLKEITINEYIGDMLIDDDGLDIAEMVCRGERVGIVLSEKDGYAGRLALTLIKTAVFSRIKSRAQIPNWRELGGKDVQVVVDECAPIIQELDEEAASQLRSLGARLVYGTQSYDQVVNRLGGTHQANAFLDSFKSIGTFSASGAGDAGMAGTYAYISTRLASSYRLDKHNTDITAVALDKSLSKTRASGIENRRLGSITDAISSVTTTIAELRSSLSISPQYLSERKDKKRLASSDTYQLRLLPAIMPEELSYLLKGTHRFAGVLMRGGVGRVVTLDMTPGIETEPDQRTVAFFKQRIENSRPKAIGVPSSRPVSLPKRTKRQAVS